MAKGYLYRSGLLALLRATAAEAPLVLWGPPGFGKTLLLKELARELDLPYRSEPGEEPGAYDLETLPENPGPGQVFALPARPLTGSELVMFGPDRLAFSRAEVAELARRLGAAKLAGEVWVRLEGWPLLVRRALEHRVTDPAEEPLRGYLEAILARLPPAARKLLDLLVLPLPEAAWRRAGLGEALDLLLDRGYVRSREGRVEPRRAISVYLERTRSLPPFPRVEGALEAALVLDPEAAFEGYLAYRRPEAGLAFERLAERLLEAGAYERIAHLWERLPLAHRTPKGAVLLAQAERSRGRLEEALALARWAADDAKVRPLAKDVEGSVLIHLGRYEEAVRAFAAGLSAAERTLAARMMTGMGAALIRAGRYPEAVRVLTKVIEAHRPLEAKVHARAEHNLGIALHHLGRLRRAVEAYRETLRLKQDQGPLTQANTLLSMGEALRLLGRFEEAHQTLKAAMEKAEAAGEYRALGYAALNLGDLYLDADWLEEAEAAYLRAETVLHDTGDAYGLGLLHLGRARLTRRQGARALARLLLERAEAAFKQGGSPAELAEVYLERALLAGQRRWLQEAEAAAKSTGSQRLLARVRAERVLAGLAGEEEAAYAARYALDEDLPMLLSGRHLPVWAQGGEAGQAALDRLAQGVGTTRVHSFGELRILRSEEVRLPTVKELWVLLFFWLRPGEDATRLFTKVKNPAKRLQIAVHHLRRALGEDWVRSRPEGYVARPLPGVWWDAGLIEAARPHLHLAPVRRLVRALLHGPFAPGAPFERERRRFLELASKIST